MLHVLFPFCFNIWERLPGVQSSMQLVIEFLSFDLFAKSCHLTTAVLALAVVDALLTTSITCTLYNGYLLFCCICIICCGVILR